MKTEKNLKLIVPLTPTTHRLPPTPVPFSGSLPSCPLSFEFDKEPIYSVSKYRST